MGTSKFHVSKPGSACHSGHGGLFRTVGCGSTHNHKDRNRNSVMNRNSMKCRRHVGVGQKGGVGGGVSATDKMLSCVPNQHHPSCELLPFTLALSASAVAAWMACCTWGSLVPGGSPALTAWASPAPGATYTLSAFGTANARALLTSRDKMHILPSPATCTHRLLLCRHYLSKCVHFVM